MNVHTVTCDSLCCSASSTGRAGGVEESIRKATAGWDLWGEQSFCPECNAKRLEKESRLIEKRREEAKR